MSSASRPEGGAPDAPAGARAAGEAPPSRGEGAHWSLTRRMALTFALTTSLIIALYGAWAGYLLCAALRTELMELMNHESRELVVDILGTDRTPESIVRVVNSIQEVFVKPACAYRVRDPSGALVAESGPRRLLNAETVMVPEDASLQLPDLLGSAPLSRRVEMTDPPLQVELIVDSRSTRATLYGFLRSVLLAFLVSLVLAALAGWYTAWRGLASLRALVSQARAIDLYSGQLPAGGQRLHLRNAPTELQQLGVELEAMLARIDDGLLHMRTFTASLAHELRSPLQNLIGETEVTLLSERSGGDYRSLLRSNLEDLNDLSDAIDNMITWCRTSDPSRQRGTLEAFDFAAEAHLRLERERRSARRVGVTLDVQSTGDTTLTADREACLRVLRNLVANAIAWSPAGTTVRVGVTGLPDRLLLCVEDEGPGIPVELGEKVFLPFVTGRPRHGQRGGYGLGLAICRSIVREHSGRLHYASREGGGTRFIAEFPRYADADGGAVPALPEVGLEMRAGNAAVAAARDRDVTVRPSEPHPAARL